MPRPVQAKNTGARHGRAVDELVRSYDHRVPENLRQVQRKPELEVYDSQRLRRLNLTAGVDDDLERPIAVGVKPLVIKQVDEGEPTARPRARGGPRRDWAAP